MQYLQSVRHDLYRLVEKYPLEKWDVTPASIVGLRMKTSICPGVCLPSVSFAELEAGELRVRSVPSIFNGKRAILIGIPGVFTPICSRIHLPKFVELTPALLASGFDLVACVSGDDAWTQTAWSNQFDPQRNIRFLSDGNLEFGRFAGLTTIVKDLFLGECMQRFSMIVDNLTVQKLSIERSVLNVTCSSAEACLDEAQPKAAA